MQLGARSLLDTIQSAVRPEDEAYISQHPELSKLLSQYLVAMAETKPQELNKFTQDYFSILMKQRDKRELTPLLIVGPSGCGKV